MLGPVVPLLPRQKCIRNPASAESHLSSTLSVIKLKLEQKKHPSPVLSWIGISFDKCADCLPRSSGRGLVHFIAQKSARTAHIIPTYPNKFPSTVGFRMQPCKLVPAVGSHARKCWPHRPQEDNWRIFSARHPMGP